MITSEYIGHERGQNKAHRLVIGKCNKEFKRNVQTTMTLALGMSEYLEQYEYMIILYNHMNMSERLAIRKPDRELKPQSLNNQNICWN